MACPLVVRLSIAVLALAHGGALLAGPYPEKPIRLVSQFPPGGGTDIIARMLAPRLGEALGQTVIVENKPGASGNIAADYVAKSPADGYTLLAANNTLVINAALPQSLPFDVQRDFAPVAVVASVAVALAVHPSVQAASVTELIALLKAQPDKWSYSSCGNGTAMHLAGELFKQATKTTMTHVPYKGCGPALADGIAGHVPVLFNNISGATTHAKAGRLRVLALASPTRSEVDPSIPSIAESGLQDFDASVWIGFLAPAGTPGEIVQKLNAEFNRVAQLPETRARLRKALFDERSGTPKQFADLIRTDIARWSKVIAEGNIRVD